MIFQSSWIQPGHGEACRRRFPILYAGFPMLAVGKPKMRALGTIRTGKIKHIKNKPLMFPARYC